MKILKFFESNIYNFDWKSNLPKKLDLIYEDNVYIYNLGNVMINANMIQCVYTHDEWAVPSDLELDLYIEDPYKILIDITFGDSMASEFSIEYPNKVSVIQYTSKGSKWDPRNTTFAFSDNSIKDLTVVLSKIGFSIGMNDLNFLKLNNK